VATTGQSEKKGPLDDVLTGARFTVGEVLELAAAQTDDAEQHLKLVFEWYHQRAVGFIRAVTTAAIALPAGLIAAGLKDGNVAGSEWAFAGGAVATGVLAFVAVRQSDHLGHLHREYLLALRLLGELRRRGRALRA
jgi:hypothetical protein